MSVKNPREIILNGRVKKIIIGLKNVLRSIRIIAATAVVCHLSICNPGKKYTTNANAIILTTHFQNMTFIFAEFIPHCDAGLTPD